MTKPQANGVECHDCPGFANYYEGVTECPEDPDHVVSEVLITTEALGRDDDGDNRLPDGRYVYDGDAIA